MTAKQIEQIPAAVEFDATSPEYGKYLYGLGKDLNDGYFIVDRAVDDRMVNIVTHNTEGEQFVAFTLTDDEGLSTRVYAYPDRVMYQSRFVENGSKTPWLDTNTLPELHRKAIDSVRRGIDEGRELEAKANRGKTGRNLLGLIGRRAEGKGIK